MTLERAIALRRTIALGLLLLGVPAYPIAWNVDPYIYGAVVLTLGSIQAAVGVLGIVVGLTRRERRNERSALVWIIDGLLITTAAAAFALLRSISWA